MEHVQAGNAIASTTLPASMRREEAGSNDQRPLLGDDDAKRAAAAARVLSLFDRQASSTAPSMARWLMDACSCCRVSSDAEADSRDSSPNSGSFAKKRRRSSWSTIQARFKKGGVRGLTDQFLILPGSTWKMRWDVLILFLILFSTVQVPFRLGFQVEAEGALWVFEAVLPLVFICDVFLQFNTAYIADDNSTVVSSRELIAKRYLSFWFWVDAPSSIPCELIEVLFASSSDAADNNTATLQALRFIRLLRIVRLARLLDLSDFIRQMEDHLAVSLTGFKLLALTVKTLLLAHILACGFYAVCSFEGDETETWVTLANLEDAPIHQKYSVAFYWSLTTLTTVGYGDITPVSESERWYTSGCLLVGAFAFAFIVGEINALLANLDRQSSLVEDKMGSLREYLVWRNIPRELALKVRRYYAHYYTKRDVFDEETILNGLNPALHRELVQYILKDTIGRVRLFEQLDPDFQIAVFPLLKPQTYNPGEAIAERGAVSDALFFLVKGELDIIGDEGDTYMRVRPDEELFLSKTGEVLGRVASNGVIGTSTLVGRRRNATMVASTLSELFLITKDDLVQLFTEEPDSAKRICKIMLREHIVQERMLRLKKKMAIAFMPYGSEARAACMITYKLRQFTQRRIQMKDPLYAMVVPAQVGGFIDGGFMTDDGGGSMRATRRRSLSDVGLEEFRRMPTHKDLLVAEHMSTINRAMGLLSPAPADQQGGGGGGGGVAAPGEMEEAAKLATAAVEQEANLAAAGSTTSGASSRPPPYQPSFGMGTIIERDEMREMLEELLRRTRHVEKVMLSAGSEATSFKMGRGSSMGRMSSTAMGSGMGMASAMAARRESTRARSPSGESGHGVVPARSSVRLAPGSEWVG